MRHEKASQLRGVFFNMEIERALRVAFRVLVVSGCFTVSTVYYQDTHLLHGAVFVIPLRYIYDFYFHIRLSRYLGHLG